MPYAEGKFAYGMCDICAFRWPLNELRFEVDNGVVTKRRVCPDCFSPDHPQNFVGRLRISDPMALRDARPENGIENSRGYFGWSPVGHELQYLTISAGEVTVTEA